RRLVPRSVEPEPAEALRHVPQPGPRLRPEPDRVAGVPLMSDAPGGRQGQIRVLHVVVRLEAAARKHDRPGVRIVGRTERPPEARFSSTRTRAPASCAAIAAAAPAGPKPTTRTSESAISRAGVQATGAARALAAGRGSRQLEVDLRSGGGNAIGIDRADLRR